MTCHETTLATSDRIAIARLMIHNIAESGHKHVLDLGAGHCRYAIMAAEEGLKVTAMDARTVRVPENLPDGVTFVHGNFLEVERPDCIDAVLMLGIFYHLSIAEQHVLLDKYRGLPALIDTHYCLPVNADVSEGDWKGLHYSEGPDIATMRANSKASMTTLRSFWHTEESLVRFLYQYYTKVTKVCPEHHPQRTFFMCEGEV